MSGLSRFLPKTVGAEPKKLALLGVLVVVLGVVFFLNSGPDVPAGAKGTTGTAQTTLPKAGDAIPGVNTPVVAPRPVARTAPRLGAGSNDTWVASIKVPEDFDLSRVDPTLQLEKLDQVRAVGAVGGRRSLFEFYTPPPPPIEVKPGPVKPPAPPSPPPPAGPVKTETPPPPRIPLQFYGYSGRLRDPNRQAFFLDGEEIFRAAENDVIRGRYKVIRLNVNSAEVEDTVTKNRQTLQLIERNEPL